MVPRGGYWRYWRYWHCWYCGYRDGYWVPLGVFDGGVEARLIGVIRDCLKAAVRQVHEVLALGPKGEQSIKCVLCTS